MMFADATPFAFIKHRLFDMDKKFCYATPIFFLALPIIGMMHRTYVQHNPGFMPLSSIWITSIFNAARNVLIPGYLLMAYRD